MTAYIVNLLGAFIFLYIFWKKSREDYTDGQIFSTAFLILLLIFALTILSGIFFAGWWFWFALLGVILGLTLSILRLRFRIYETVDRLCVSFLPWLGLIFLFDSFANYSWISLAAFLVVSLSLVMYAYLNNRYKKFVWYKSGKVGFAGIFVLGVFFLLRGVIAIILPSVLSFVGMYDAIISGSFAFVCFLMLYNLAKSQ